MLLYATKRIEEKINDKHNVTMIEVEEAFAFFEGYALIDDRSEHRTDPPTEWIISETACGRVLKVIYIPYEDDNEAILRTAYEPSEEEINLWNAKQ